MGAGLAILALRIPDLSDRARLVLFVMALHARDTPSATTPDRVYNGGWNLLAWEALGYWGTDPASQRTPRDRAAHKAVLRAIRELDDRGLVKSERGRHDPLVMEPRRPATTYHIGL